MEVLRVCRVCGLEALNEADLVKFRTNHLCTHGKENLCKHCQKAIDKAYSKTEQGKEAHNRARRRWEKDNPEKFKEIVRKYRSTDEYKKREKERMRQSRKRDPERGRVITKRARQRLKMTVFKKLGDPPECVNCSISDMCVLTVDHINDNGAQERAKLDHDEIFRKIRDMPLEEARKEYQYYAVIVIGLNI